MALFLGMKNDSKKVGLIILMFNSSLGRVDGKYLLFPLAFFFLGNVWAVLGSNQ